VPDLTLEGPRRAKSAGPIVVPTGRSAIISPEATCAHLFSAARRGSPHSNAQIFRDQGRPIFFAAAAPRAASFGTRAGREADRSLLARFSRRGPSRA
jgi:hypothetical protein